MEWHRVGKQGMQSGEYRVGKFANAVRYLIDKTTTDDGALCTVYRLHFGHEDLGWFADFESAKEAAQTHQNALGRAK